MLTPIQEDMGTRTIRSPRSAAAGFAVLLLVGAGCAAPAEPQTWSGPVETIRIANIGEYSLLNLIAREKGFFAANGLEARVEEYDSGATSVGAVLAGEADVAVAADFVGVRRMFDEPDLRVLAHASDHEVFRLVARRDKGISAPTDLRGKTVGVTLTTAGELLLGRFLTLHGMRRSDITAVDMPPAEMVAAIEDGAVDAVLVFHPHAYGIERRLGGRVVSWSAHGGRRTLAVIYATRRFVERHPGTAERYLRALVQAQAFLESHDADARRILTETMGYDPAYVDATWPDFRHRVALDQDLVLAFEEQARWLIDRGIVDRADIPNYLDAIWFTGLERVAPAAVTIVHGQAI